MKKNLVMNVMVVVALGCVGCGDKSPSEKCEDLVDVTCDRIVECITGAAGMHGACVNDFKQVLSCSDIKSVKPSYDRCVDSLNEQSCKTLFPADPMTGEQTVELPDECNGVLSMETMRGEVERVPHATAPPADPIDDMAVRVRAMLESRRE